MLQDAGWGKTEVGPLCGAPRGSGDWSFPPLSLAWWGELFRGAVLTVPSRAGLRMREHRQNEAFLFPPFCGYSQVFCPTVLKLSGLLSSPGADFVEMCPMLSRLIFAGGEAGLLYFTVSVMSSAKGLYELRNSLLDRKGFSRII